MDWKLLDFRIGRANRGQFWTVLFSSLVILIFFFAFKSNFLIQVFIFAILLYAVILISLRRLRDIGDGDAVEDISTVDAIVFIESHVDGDFLTLIQLLFLSGNKLKNRFGYPPEGLDFRTMISEDYTPKQKQEIEHAKNTHYTAKNEIKNEEPYEVKGRP